MEARPIAMPYSAQSHFNVMQVLPQYEQCKLFRDRGASNPDNLNFTRYSMTC